MTLTTRGGMTLTLLKTIVGACKTGSQNAGPSRVGNA
jgi:hypothetical protein